jgi:hypothetical protein
MSDKPIELVIANLKTVNEACKILGNNVIRDLFMLLSFLTLSVIPSLKLTDRQRVIRYRKISAHKLVGTISAAIANVVPFLYP